MGVTHKLKPEVIDFIVQQKKSFPNISCRHLSEVVSTTFKIKVSKSSINSVLQESHLSSPVGRRQIHGSENNVIVKKPAGQFKIPEQRKKEILQRPQPPEITKVIVPEPTKTKEPLGEKAPVVGVAKMSNLNLAVPKPSLEPSPVAVETIENAGVIFLQAAQWDLAGGSILGKMIKEEFNGEALELCNQATDFCIFKNILNIDQLPTTFSRETAALQKITGLKQENRADIINLADKIKAISDFGMKASVEVETLFQRVAFVKIHSTQGEALYFNPRTHQVFLDNVQSADCSLAAAVKIITDNILNNVQSAVFYASTPEFPEKLISVLQNIFTGKAGQGFKEISLHDKAGVEMAKYPYSTQKERDFILGFTPTNAILSKLQAGVSGVAEEVFEYPAISQKVYCRRHSYEDLSTGKQNNLSFLALHSSSSEPPFMILIVKNLQETASAKEAVSKFLQICPEIHGVTVSVLNSTQEESLSEFSELLMNLGISGSLEEGMVSLQRILSLWAQKRFRNTKDLILDEENMKVFYNLAGEWREDDYFLNISLILSSLNEKTSVLPSAVSALNQSLIFTPHGKRLLLDLQKTRA